MQVSRHVRYAASCFPASFPSLFQISTLLFSLLFYVSQPSLSPSFSPFPIPPLLIHLLLGDLKPANFVFVKGHLKLIDFGIAKAFSNDTTNIYRESQIGTVSHPENAVQWNTVQCDAIIFPLTDNLHPSVVVLCHGYAVEIVHAVALFVDLPLTLNSTFLFILHASNALDCESPALLH